MASIAAFSKETEFSRPFGRWDLVAMVETQGSCEETARGAGCEEESEPLLARASVLSLSVSDVFGRKKVTLLLHTML